MNIRNLCIKINNMIGKKFGKLKVISLHHTKQKYSKNKGVKVKDGFAYYYECECECGNVCVVEKYKLKSGHTKSCGCLKKEKISNLNYKHGMEKSRLYHIWQGVKRRCLNSNEIGYKDYGAKGITICDEWKNNSSIFIEWALNNGYNDSLTIDRIDNTKGYNPENCRWSTPAQQARNTKTNHLITYNNKTYCIAEWAEILGFSYNTLYNRINKYKWTIEKAFTTPQRKRTGNK